MKDVTACEEATMSARHAWKAFRMGIVASGCGRVVGPDAQNFWRSMRKRFDEWYRSYAQGRESLRQRLLAEAQSSEPFNTPRLRRFP